MDNFLQMITWNGSHTITTLDLFWVVLFIIFFFSILSSLFVFIKNPKSPINFRWALFSGGVAGWSYSATHAFFATSYSEALFWGKVLTQFVNPIPLLLLHFTYECLEKKDRKLLYVLYPFVACLSGFSLFKNEYFMDMIPMSPFPYYIHHKIGYDIFLIYFFLVSYYSIFLLFKSTLKESGKKRKQLTYLLLGLTFGFSGGATGFFYACDIHILPWGYIFVSLYVILTTYAITKHDLMDIPILISKAAANTVVSIIISISTYLLYFFTKDIPSILLASGILLALFWLTYAKNLRYFIQTPLEKKFIKGWYDEHDLLKEFLNALATCKTYPDLIPVIDKSLRDHMEISTIAIYFSAKLDDPNTTSEDYLAIYEYPRQQHTIAYKMTAHIENYPMIKINLGPKLSEDSFNQKDYDVLRTIESQLSQAINRINQTRQYEIQRQEKQLAEAANHHKTRFLAQVCHDLRNPLHTVIGFSDYLKNHQEGEVEKIATMIHDSSQLLLQSIDDLIDIERIEKGDIPVHHESFCLQNLLEEISATMTLSLAPKPEVIFKLTTSNIPPQLTTDPGSSSASS